MDRVCKKWPEVDIVKPDTYAATDTPTQNSEKGIPHRTTPMHTTNPSDDQNTCMDLGKGVHVPQEGTSNTKHHDKTKYNTEIVTNCESQWQRHENHSQTSTGQREAPENDRPTSAANTDAIRHSQRETVQTLTFRLSTEDQESPNKRISTTYLWRKFSEAINTLKATATHKLTATSLSLSKRDGIGDLHTPPAPTDQATRNQLSCHVVLKIVGGFSMLFSNVTGKGYSCLQI